MPLIRNTNDLGDVIRRERRRRGLTQAALAQSIGVSRQWLLAVEKGKPGAEVERVLRLLAVLGVPLFAGVRAPVEEAIDLDRVVDDARRGE